MKFLKKLCWSILALTSTAFTFNLFACTDFRMTANDGTVIITRSMEYALDLKSNIRTSNRGRLFNLLSANGQAGMSWKAKYGYVYLDGLNVDIAIDGMNEKGLSIEALYLPNFAQYQVVPSGKDKQGLPYLEFGNWILSNFATVDEVRKELPNIYVFAEKMPGMGNIVFPLHFSIFEASGKGIIVEYINGNLHMYDNTIGVLTNSPSYDWHLTNLNNYIHLTPTNPSPIVSDGLTFAATGQGFGMIGVPGDISPPSRFVKIATMLRVILSPHNATNALNVAEHLINNVDIPRGLAREAEQGKMTNEITQWVVFKDLVHKVLYYRSYGNLSLRAIYLDKLNFAENSPRLKMPLASNPSVQDMTSQLLTSTQA